MGLYGLLAKAERVCDGAVAVALAKELEHVEFAAGEVGEEVAGGCGAGFYSAELGQHPGDDGGAKAAEALRRVLDRGADLMDSSAYGILRDMPVFSGLGLVGGLISAWMPSLQNDIPLSALLQALAVSSAAAVCGSNRWRTATMLLWPVAMFGQWRFFTDGSIAWQWRALLLDG
jgi:hypothetical protein